MADNIHSLNPTNGTWKALLVNEADSLGLYSSTGTGFDGAVGNVIDSGQLGLGPHITRIDGITPQVHNKATVVLLAAPTFWRFWRQLPIMLKSLFETHAKSITGITLEYTLDKQDVPAGQDGQNLSMPTFSGRQSISPSITWNEIYGNVVGRIHQKWINDIMHADTHVSQLGAVLTQKGELDNLPPWIFSTFSASMIIIQQDPTGLPDRLSDAVVVNNMFPLTSSPTEFKVEVNTSEVIERSINYTGHLTHNDHTRELGKLILEALQLHVPNWNYQTLTTSSNKATNGVAAELNGHGLSKRIKEAINDFQFGNV